MRQKMIDLHINLSEQDYKHLEKISNLLEVSKSKVIRKFLRTEKYNNQLANLEIQKEIAMQQFDLLKNIANNINQIAYALNMGFIKDDLKDEILRSLYEMKKICDELKNLNMSLINFF